MFHDGERYIFDSFNIASFKKINNSINNSVSSLIYLGSDKTLTTMEVNNLDRMALA